MAEFDLWLRTNLGCILDFETEISEAAEVLFAIDELNAAMTLRIGLEEEEEEAAAGDDEDEDTTTEDDYFNAGNMHVASLCNETRPVLV